MKLYCSMRKNIDFKNKVNASMYGPKESLRGMYKERGKKMEEGQVVVGWVIN